MTSATAYAADQLGYKRVFGQSLRCHAQLRFVAKAKLTVRIGALCATKGNCSLICNANDIYHSCCLGVVAGSYPGIDIDIHCAHQLHSRRWVRNKGGGGGRGGVALPVCVSHVDLIRRSHANNVRVALFCQLLRVLVVVVLLARCFVLRCSCKTEVPRCRSNYFYIVS